MSPFQIKNPGRVSHKYRVQGNSLHFNDNISSWNELFFQYVFHSMIKTENCTFKSLPEIFPENIIFLEKSNSSCSQFTF